MILWLLLAICMAWPLAQAYQQTNAFLNNPGLNRLAAAAAAAKPREVSTPALFCVRACSAGDKPAPGLGGEQAHTSDQKL